MVGNFFYFFNNIIETVFLQIEFFWFLLNFDVFNYKPNFLAKFILNVIIRFVLYSSIIALYMLKKFCDFIVYSTYFFNQALNFNKALLSNIVFLYFIENKYI